jgi:antitoxin component YwqK of YwqJK toxin-antitoxin module
MSKCSFNDGKYDGIWEKYWDNGQLHSKGLYKDGKEEGIWEKYRNNGQLISKDLFKDGRLIKTITDYESI